VEHHDATIDFAFWSSAWKDYELVGGKRAMRGQMTENMK